jgi:hypothetical protein
LPKQRQRRHAGRGGDGDEHGGALLVEARCGPAAVECGEDARAPLVVPVNSARRR